MNVFFSCLGFASVGTPRIDQHVTAHRVLDIILAANSIPDARKQLSNIITVESWTSNLAQSILHDLVDALGSGVKYAGAMRQALTTVERTAEGLVDDAKGFAREHPVYTTLIAIGILALIAPWALEAVGFAFEGPIEGSWAALWQSTYAGSVPRGSLFSFFQRLGMTLQWKIQAKADTGKA